MPPDGNELASGSPWTRFLPENSAIVRAVAGRGQERVVLLGGRAGHRHEPVGVVGRALGQRPLLHAVGDRVHDRRVERLVTVDRLPQFRVDRLGQVLALGDVVEHVLAVDVGARAFEVILGLRDPVRGDLRDGSRSGGHGSPVCAVGSGVRSGCRPRVRRHRPRPARGRGRRHHGSIAEPPRLTIAAAQVAVQHRPETRNVAPDGRPHDGPDQALPRAATSWSSRRPNSRSTST